MQLKPKITTTRWWLQENTAFIVVVVTFLIYPLP